MNRRERRAAGVRPPKPPPPQEAGGPEDPQSGAYPRGIYAAPWQGRMPVSQRTHRPVALSTAQRDYDDSIDSVPIADEGMVGGFWDYDQERAMGPRKGPSRPERHDAEAMDAFWRAQGHRWTPHQIDVYHAFWVRRLSYAEVGRELGTSRERVYECIKRMRREGASRNSSLRQNPHGVDR